MNADKVRELVGKRPFRSLTLRLSDGRSCEVVHPETLAVAPSGRFALLLLPDDSSHYIDMLHVVKVVMGPPSDGGLNGNGQRPE